MGCESAAPTGYVYPFAHPALTVKLVGITFSYTFVIFHPNTTQFALAFAGFPVGANLNNGVLPPRAEGGWVMMISPAAAVAGMVKCVWVGPVLVLMLRLAELGLVVGEL